MGLCNWSPGGGLARSQDKNMEAVLICTCVPLSHFHPHKIIGITLLAPLFFALKAEIKFCKTLKVIISNESIAFEQKITDHVLMPIDSFTRKVSICLRTQLGF